MKFRFWAGIVLIAVAAGSFAYRGRMAGYVAEKWEKRGVPEAQTHEKMQASLEIRDAKTASPITTNPQNDFPQKSSIVPSMELSARGDLPAEFNLAVPFTSQAPFANWDALHEDACEEAAVMMVDAFFKGHTFTRESADQEIYAIADWETKTFGYWKDTDAAETARILREYYGYENVRVVDNPTIEDIKREVAQGRPVILPAAGQLLGNRYFHQPGPLYHMLIVRGWTKDGKIITNDPGTKRGEAYLYDPAVLMNAVHDWIPPLASGGRNGGDVLNGRKVMIVVEK
ncbi:C39 family peptidase [Candidatus Uhrbacteria bacterium]|nr:C39 family peptidase [Candidatus Uhrbacteria bacterium]